MFTQNSQHMLYYMIQWCFILTWWIFHVHFVKHFHRKYSLVNITKYCIALDQSKRFITLYHIINMDDAYFTNMCWVGQKLAHLHVYHCLVPQLILNVLCRICPVTTKTIILFTFHLNFIFKITLNRTDSKIF